MGAPQSEPIQAATQKYTCPKCGGDMNFDAAKGMLACPFCGHSMPTPETSEVVQEHDLREALRDTSGKAHGFGTAVKSIKCNACGATNNVAPNVASTSCPFCGSNQVVEQPPDPNLIQPESLIPFGVDDSRAQRLFLDWLGRGLFHPSDLKKFGGGQKLSGVYLPFWTFDAHAESDWRAESGDYYYVNETVWVTRDGKQLQETRQVQKVRWYPSSGHRSDDHDDVLVYATSSIDVKMIERVYPFDTQKLAPYNPSFLSGWGAESYRIPLADAWKLGQSLIEREQYSRCGRDVPGDTHRNLHVNTRLSNLTYKHVLLPVWLASYRYNNKVYRFMINGQTGEVQGQKPISWIKVAIAVVIALIVIGLIVYLVSQSQSGGNGTGTSGGLLMLDQYAAEQLI
ncbi:MAG TPA: primosomal protein N' (replication factor Y) - superfamily II helicase [Anaerolineae bacterium]|nr:primosomal protein N' (replication factor Y) - superfamily II helicase [Anaerolineae bacterium]